MKHTALALLLSLSAVLPATPARAGEPQDIVSTAVGAGSFRTLAKALTAAGLIETLQGPGPFTVFAPTDEAFARLPKGTVESLLEPSQVERLRAVLTYHVVAGRVLSTDLLAASSAKSLQGSALPLGLRVGSANVVRADILCTNGVIHVIDEVLLPPAAPSPAPRSTASADGIIRAAISRGAPLYNEGHVAACVATYEEAARALLALPEGALGVTDRRDVGRVLASTARDESTRAWDLRKVFDRVLDNEAFRPMVEAPMPAGFPAPGPLGRVVEKTYPAYRAARAEGGRGSFWTLFQHIKKNDIAMTAPVEMTMDEGLRMERMAFLYEKTALGAPGMDGAVEVTDLPGVTVLSIGMRGEDDRESLAAAKAAIEARLAEAGWKPAGDWRLLGYNSPMVPSARRFWELQLPVTR